MWISSQIWVRTKHTKLDQSTIRLKTNPFGQNNREKPRKKVAGHPITEIFRWKYKDVFPLYWKYYICLRKGNNLDIFRYLTVVQELVLSNPVLDILIDICTHQCTSTHSFKSRRLFPILPLATKPYLSRSFLQEKQFGATLDGVQIWGACALLSHVISPFFSKQKNLDDTKHGPSIIWSGRVVNEWHQMCHNGVTLIIFFRRMRRAIVFFGRRCQQVQNEASMDDPLVTAARQHAHFGRVGKMQNWKKAKAK